MLEKLSMIGSNNVRCAHSPTNTACAGQLGCICFAPIVIGAVTTP